MGNCLEVREEQGFKVYRMSNQQVELAVVPELGAKIISLKNRRTGREWLWRPAGGLRLFTNQSGDDFSRSTLVGADECLPTIAPCLWRGRQLPDHGEVWGVPWAVNGQGWEAGVLQTRACLAISPFVFERAIELRENEICLSYQLDNLSATEESFLWAIHPLLNVDAGVRLELPASTRSLFNGESWIDDLGTAIPEGRCAKAFASPLLEGRARIVNQTSGDWLELEWDPKDNNTLGVWLSRGGWHDHHHLAVEPGNGAPDALDSAARQKRCGVIAASCSLSWRVCFRIGP
jgi:galactose mutarotase-like enzyme